MKNVILCSILILLLSTIYTPYAYAEKYDFRSTYWGMSKEQVKETEHNTILIDDDDLLTYPELSMMIKCTLFFEFDNDKLVSAGYACILDNIDEAYKVYSMFITEMDKIYTKFAHAENLYKTSRSYIHIEKPSLKDNGFTVTFSEISYFLKKVEEWKRNQ